MPRKIPTFRPPHAVAERADNVKRYESTPERIEARRFYHSARWLRFARLILRERPVCEACQRQPANTVHHVKPRRSHPALAFDEANVKAWCASCHSRFEASIPAGAGAVKISTLHSPGNAIETRREFSQKNDGRQ